MENLATNPQAKIEDLLDLDEKGRPSFAASNGRVSGTGEPTDSPYTGGTVYYYINSDVPDQNEITAAIADWDSKTSLTSVQLSSPGSSTSSNWIEFIKRNSGCSSTIPGFQSWNRVYVSQSCITDNIKHEIGHALGLFHEHQRVDRDSEIEVFWNNIPEENRNQYRLMNTLILNYTLGNGYASFTQGNLDFNSIMIYNSFQNINGQSTLVLTRQNGPYWSKTGEITPTDIATIDRIFNDNIEDKLVFSPFDLVATKSGCTFNLSWGHNGGLSGLAGEPNEFWLFKMSSGNIDEEWSFYKKITGGSTRSHSFTDCSVGYLPRWRLAAVKSTTGAYSPSAEAIYDLPGNCACSDDTELNEVVYIEPSSSNQDYLYEVGWKEMPTSYSQVELWYTTNSGQSFLLKSDFVGCETGWEWFALPDYHSSDGPSSFWIFAKDGSTTRNCNGSLWSSYYKNRQQ